MTKEERGIYWALLVVAFAISVLSVFGVYDWTNDILTGEQLRKQVHIYLMILISVLYLVTLYISVLCFIRGSVIQKVASAICLVLSAISIAGLVGLFAFDRAYLYFGLD